MANILLVAMCRMALKIQVIIYSLIISLTTCNHLPYSKCLLTDTSCLTIQASAVCKDFVKGIPELGVDRLEEITLNLKRESEDLNFDFRNMVVTGLENAVIEKLSVDTDFSVVRLLLHTNLNFNAGYFKTEGSLFSLPLNATGSGDVTVDKIYIDLLFPFEIIQNKDGKDVMNLKKYHFGFQIIGDIHFDYKFHGEQLNVSKMNFFMNDVWRLTTRLYGVHFYDAVANKIYEALQIYLKTQPLAHIAIYENKS